MLQEKNTVLIIDDEETVVRALRMLLEDKYNIVTFTTHSCGVESINWIQKESSKFDYAILDILINGVSGVDIANEIIKKYNNKIPLMFMTGCASSSSEYAKAKNLSLTFKDTIKFCEKPYDSLGRKYSNRIKEDLENIFGGK